MKKNRIIRLNLGSGLQIRSGYINVDKFYTEEQLRSKKGYFKQTKIEKGGTYIQADILNLPFDNNFADYVELFNVIEHFPMNNVINYMKEIYRVMKKGAKLLILTNNMNDLAVEWLDMLAHPPFDPKTYNDIAETIYGNQAAEGEIHLCPFTPDFMNYVLTQAGFTNGTVALFKKYTMMNILPKEVLIGLPLRKGAMTRNGLIYAEAIK